MPTGSPSARSRRADRHPRHHGSVHEPMAQASAPQSGETQARVRRIRADEGALLKTLRVRALAEEPEAFGESVAEAEARDEAEFMARARAASVGGRRAWFLAELGPEPGSSAEHVAVGLAMGRRRPPDTCMVFSVWVAGTARRRGVGRALVDAIAGWARSWGASLARALGLSLERARHPILRTPRVQGPVGRTRCRARCAARRAGDGARRRGLT